MRDQFPDGIWPVMLTPYTHDNLVDYEALARLVEWYIEQGVDGLFAVCQSSEMFQLSLEERVRIAAFVKKEADIPVIASGHISDGMEEQAAELSAMAQTGVDALILISNRLAGENEDDNVFLDRLGTLLDRLPPEMPLGFYECPYPYKRLLSPAVIQYLVRCGRFYFIKDTSCDVANMREKLAVTRGSRLKLYNANTATLLESLELGASGYSGVMANFHPQLYCRLFREYRGNPEQAAYLQEILTMCSLIECRTYPVNAKYLLQRQGIFKTIISRKFTDSTLSEVEKIEVEQLNRLTETLCRQLV